MSRPDRVYTGRGNEAIRLVNRRTKARAVHGGYIGARFSTGRSYIDDWTADSPIELDSFTRSELMRKGRWFRKNTGLPRAVAKDLSRTAIGAGIIPLPDTDFETANQEYFEYFQFAQSEGRGDVRGKSSWFEYQAQKVGMKFFDADAHTKLSLSKNYFPQFQSIRSHNVGNFDIDPTDERWKDGVKVNAYGRHMAYRIKTKKGASTVPASFMLQSFLMDDPDQVRGITCLAHAINDLHDVLDILSLEKAAVKENSRVARTLTRQYWEDDEEGPDLEENGDDDTHFLGDPDGAEPGALDPSIPIERIFGSEVVRLAQGEKLESYVSSRPSAAFTGFLDWLGRSITAGCGWPYEFSWNPTGINSAGVRSIQGRINAACREWQRNEFNDTLRYYRFVILSGIARGDLKPVKGWYKADIFPGAPEVSIDKGRDGKLEIAQVKQNLLTLQQYHAVRGRWWKKEAKQMKAEKEWYEANELDHPSQIHAQDSVGPARDNDDDEDEDDEEEKKKKDAA